MRLLLPLLLAAACTPAAAQSSLDARIGAVRDGAVQLSYPARAGVCGNGRTYLSTAPGEYTGTFVTGTDETLRREPCEAGPVRVRLARAGGETVRVETFVGPLQPDADATDLGPVAAADAAAWLLALAARGEGAPARAAILPAVLAEGAEPWPALLALARDADRPLDVRRSAIGWLARGVGDARAEVGQVRGAVLALARDRDERQELRTRALSGLAQLPDGAGLGDLTAIARGGDDPWLAEQVMRGVATSGDPRARRFLRDAAADASLGAARQRAAVRGLGRAAHATGEDAAALRALLAGASEEVGAEVVRAVGAIGGRENARWLLGVARDAARPVALRRAALRAAARDDVAVEDLVGLYDAAPERALRQELVSLLAQRPEPAATDKLLAIARSADDRALQRMAINRLSRSDEPRVREALEGIVTRP